MGARDSHRGVDDARTKHIRGFAVGTMPLGVAHLDLGIGQSGPAADIDLAQANIGRYRHALALGDDQRGLVRALQVARVDDVDRDVGEPRRELACLFAPALVELDVGVALPATDPIPLGLAVPDQIQQRHRRRLWLVDLPASTLRTLTLLRSYAYAHLLAARALRCAARMQYPLAYELLARLKSDYDSLTLDCATCRALREQQARPRPLPPPPPPPPPPPMRAS